ncbi:MAG: vitamin B12-dependent ribonucleotide reductase [Clostridia bacterium]|nr:vitamin B12-dependent ribonucleotide reductase [Clostridia bacterium]
MNIGTSGLSVLKKRYLIKDEMGNPTENVEDMFNRVADTIASADEKYGGDVKKSAETFYNMMTELEFLPNSPTLMNAGRLLGQLSACFVLPVDDSMEDIFEAIKNAALIHKSGGGTGFSFTRLRQKGAPVNSTGGVASGPVTFMKVFNSATEAVKQGGTRRGANMGMLQIDHPDILEFIDCKADGSEITNFNISVAVTEKFMEAAIKGENYDLIDPRTKETVGQLNAKEVFDKIVTAAHKNGEPGIVFIDRLNRDNVVPNQGKIEATNPCGEQPLLPYESCNLGSINLVAMLRETENGHEVDFEKLERVTRNAVHFLDNVIDVNNYPLEAIGKTTRDTRKIGLGVMGFADMLLLLGIPYNSEEGVAMAEKVMGFINNTAKDESRKLAQVRGAFPLFAESIYAEGDPVRNGTVTTIAPTGTLSIIAGVSSGVEPVFAYVFIRNVMDGTEFIEVNPILKKTLLDRGIYSDALMKKISSEGSLAHIDEIPEDIKRVFVSAHDVSPEWHIRMQAAFQNNIDNAVSKTVNFESSATKEDVEEVYLLAYKLGCKGVTIYRDGSRMGQVLNVGKVNNGEKAEAEAPPYGSIVPRSRPVITQGYTERVKIGCGKLYITVNYDENGICEVFTSTGRHGGCPSQSEAISRLTSIALRSGVDINSILEQLRGIRCPSTIRHHDMCVTSCPDAIAKTIEKVMKMHDAAQAIKAEAEKPAPAPAPKPQAKADEDKHTMMYCPECGEKIEHAGGCVICPNCGYSKCG